MTLIMSLAAIVFGALRGVSEGMDMSLRGDPKRKCLRWPGDGPRGHRWFRWYHLLELAMWAVYTSLVWLIITIWPGWLTLSGLALIVWEMTEIGYSVSRWGKLKAYEHIMSGDLRSWYLTGWQVYAAHGIRALAGTILIIAGGRI